MIKTISKKRKEAIENNPFWVGPHPTCYKCGRRVFAWQERCGDVIKNELGIREHKNCEEVI